MIEFDCPCCGRRLRVEACDARPSQQSPPVQQRRPTAPNGPATLAEALDYLLPLGKYKGRSLRDVARADPAWVRWAAATLDRAAGKACALVAGSLGDETPHVAPADRSDETERHMAEMAY